MEKKENDVKFIVGIIILLVIFTVGGSFWNLVARQAEKDKQEEACLEQEAIRAIYEAEMYWKEMVSWIWTKNLGFLRRYSWAKEFINKMIS